MRIGITGGSGFIGSHVVDNALTNGHDVTLFDRTQKAPRLELGAYGARVEMFHGDIRDPDSVAELAAHVDGIIHLAACLGTQETITNPYPAVHTNIVGGVNVLQACAQYDVPAVYIGVGNYWMQNSYSITKTTVERFIHMYNAERGTTVNIVRAVNAYGPRQSVAPPFGPAKVRKITPSFVCRALTGTPIQIYGDGHQVSDMVHVRDVADVLVAALEAAAAGHRFPTPVEVGPAEHSTVGQVADLVAEVAADITGTAHVPVEYLPMRPGEQPGARVTADVATLALVGRDPAGFVALDAGIADTVRWYAEHWLPPFMASRGA